MDSLEGHLLVPPDRSQILGRQSWKTRYVVVGSRQSARKDRQGSQSISMSTSSFVNSVLSKSVGKNESDDVHLSVFKSKDDGEPVQRWLLAQVSDCQVQQLSHRKQGPVLPTLVVTISENPPKRRSSRAAGFITSNKDPAVKTLWFRTPPDDHHPSLHEWARYIMARKSAASNVESPMSPVFTSPFQTPTHDKPDYFQPPGGSSRGLQHKGSPATYSTGPLDRSVTFSSESLSLRSRRSDISSPSTHNHSTKRVPGAISEQHYTTILPGDIGPLGHHGENQGQLIDQCSSLRGRSSTMNSPIRGRDSIGSQSQPLSPIVDFTSPPAPGETILDRAFQLGQIPGAESPIPGQENLSSIARFDALMRESEDKRRRQGTSQRGGKGGKLRLQIAFDNDDDDDDDDDDDSVDDAEGEVDGDSDSETDHDFQHQPQNDLYKAPLMSPSAQRALAYITSGARNESDRGSKSHRPCVSRTDVSFHDAAPPPSSAISAPPLRPHTAHTKSRPNGPRSPSTSPVTPTATSTTGADLPSSSRAHNEAQSSGRIADADKRRSGSSGKRSSYQRSHNV
ncbi:hypothetical protein E4U41_005291 [Claviceps citrina]|nr:hypothetical protein E4U41_005291 [Claviceps citrina]